MSFVSRTQVLQTDPALRVTRPYFTKYEYTALLAVRAQQLADGATPVIDVDEFKTEDPRYIWNVAEQEILSRKLPFLIERPLPDGVSEYWSVSELELAW